MTGAFYKYKKYIAWEFCDMEGEVQQQLDFCLDEDLECTPNVVIDWEKVCEALEQKEKDEMLKKTYAMTLKGSVNIAGMTNGAYSASEMDILKSALVKEFSEAGASEKAVKENVNVLSWKASDASVSSRALKASVGKLSFSVKLSPSDLGVNEKDSKAMSEFATNLKSYMQRSMKTGLFVGKVVSTARNAEEDSLKSVNLAELLEFDVVHETDVNRGLSVLASIVVVVGASIGIVVGVVFNSHRRVKVAYDSVSTEPSEHSSF